MTISFEDKKRKCHVHRDKVLWPQTSDVDGHQGPEEAECSLPTP